MLLLTLFLSISYGIYGGLAAQPGYLPFQVSFVAASSSSLGVSHTFQVGIFIPLPFVPPPANFVLCGGVILDATHVLTAGHCAYDVDNRFLFNATTANFRTGTQYDVPSPQFGVLQYIHPTYAPWNSAAQRVDMAVFKVSPPFTFNANVQPVTLATGDLEAAGSVLQISGYGLTPTGLPSNQLLYVNMTVVSNTVCNTVLQGLGASQPLSTFCAQGATNQSFCTGDSGGPFVKDISGSWALVGIARGLTGACGGASTLGVFSSINSQRAFISSAQADTAKSGAPSAAAVQSVSALLLALLILGSVAYL